MQPPPDVTIDGGKSSLRALTIVDEKAMRILDLAAVLPSLNTEPQQKVDGDECCQM